jgi:MarC family membrane protein
MQDVGVLSTFAATLFALLNPLGMLPVFIGYTAGLSIGVQRWLALFVSLTVLALMLVFLFTGHAILSFFGISLDSFRLAGGIVLLLIGIRIVNGDSSQAARDQVVEATTSTLSEAKSIYRRIVVPFAMPLLVGPGVIANLILYASEARAAQNDTLLLGLVGVTIAISVLTFALLLSGRFLRDLMGDVGLSIVTRILGLLVASIGMQFIVTGLSNVIVQSIAPAVLKLQT